MPPRNSPCPYAARQAHIIHAGCWRDRLWARMTALVVHRLLNQATILPRYPPLMVTRGRWAEGGCHGPHPVPRDRWITRAFMLHESEESERRHEIGCCVKIELG